MPYTLSLNMKF